MKRLNVWRAMAPAVLLGASGVLAGCNGSGGAAGVSGSSGNGGSSGDALATVAGQGISRDDVRNYLEGSQGELALRQLIDQQLILQKLKQEGLQVPDDEVNTFIEKQAAAVQKQAATEKTAENQRLAKQFADLLKTEGPRQDAFRNGVRRQLALQKLLLKDAKVTDAQLESYFKKNAARYGTQASVKLGLLATATSVRANVLANQLKSKAKTFDQLVEEQQKANDQVARNSTKSAPFPANQLATVLGPVASAAVGKLQVGGVTPVIPLAPPGSTTPAKLFIIARLAERTPTKPANFADVRAAVAQNYIVEQQLKNIPPELLRNQDPQTIGSRIYTQQQDAYIAKLRNTGSVSVSDPAFASVAEAYKPSAQSGATPGAASDSPASGSPASGSPTSNTATSGTGNSATTGQ